MKRRISRRSFGALTLGMAAAGLPVVGSAQAVQYANPHLLMSPDALMDALAPKPGHEDLPQGVGIAIIDVRPREDYDAGHIAGAIHLDPNAVVAPHSPVAGALHAVPEIERLLGSLGVDASTLVVFYDDRGGFHAARMLWLMEYLGHKNAAVLNGGYSGWTAQGGPTTSQWIKPTPRLFQAALSPRRHASAEDVLAHRSDPDGVLIDVRPTHMFEGGHIPWAINIPWADNLDANGFFRPAEALLGHFEHHGVTPERNVVMHCEVGLASSHSYVALRLLGFPRVRVYHRSWAEWGTDPDLPKAIS